MTTSVCVWTNPPVATSTPRSSTAGNTGGGTGCADPEVAMRDPRGLWEDLVQRSEKPGNLLRTGF